MSGKKNFLPEKINSSKKNYTIDGTMCSLRNSVSAMPFPFLAFVAFGTGKGLLRYEVQFIQRRAAPENKSTKAAIASATFVVLKAKYKYLILLQGS